MSRIHLSENIRHLRKLEKISQKELAESLEIPRSTLNNWERGSSEPKLESIIKLAEYFDVSVGDLIEDNIEYLQKGDYDNGVKVLALTLDELERPNVELVESKAEAGYLGGFQDPEYIKELPRFSFPNLSHGNYRGFEIVGDSMLPVESGSIIISQYVEKLSHIKDGETYIIVSKDGLVYKRVYKDEKKHSLLLCSDNPLYKAYEIPYEEVQELWAYHAHLSFNNGKDVVDAMMEDRLKELNEKVDKIYNYLLDKERPKKAGEKKGTKKIK